MAVAESPHLLRTEVDFTLPLGYVDRTGTLHREGVMRLATAADEIQSLVQRLVIKVPRDAWDNLDYVYACWALSKLDRKPPQSVEELASSPDETLAEPAKVLLTGNTLPWWLRCADC